MNKSNQKNGLHARSGLRVAVAVSLTLSLGAFGCTTDRHLGDGDPVTTPGVRTSPTGGVSSGSESTPQNPPMMSSSRFDAARAVRPRRLRPDEAAMIMAEQAPRVRVLGPAMPGDAGRPYESDGLVTGQFVNPALQTNPQATVNSSISSNPTPAIASGAGGAVGGGVVASGVVTGTGVTLGSTVTGTSGAVFAAPAGAAATPTGAAIALPTGTFATTTVSPTAVSVVNPPASISATPALGAVASQRTATGLVTTSNASAAGGTSTTASATSTRTATGSATGGVSNPVRMVVGANGRTTITNQK